MNDGGGGLGFPGEPFSRRPIGRVFRCQHFDGNGPMQRRIEGFQHHPHPALPNHFKHFIGAQPAEGGCVVRRLQETQINLAAAAEWCSLVPQS